MSGSKATTRNEGKSKWQLWTGRKAMKDWEIILAFTAILLITLVCMRLEWYYLVSIPVVGGSTSLLRWFQENFPK